MADPFTIAVSVAGLTSLGIQLAQGLKKYADSAIDSKGRILAISIDIELAVQVIKTLDATLQNTSSRALLTDDAKKLAKDVVSQCQDLFKAINAMIPDIKLLGVKKIDMIKWPIIEAKVEVFRGNLEKIKLTLQLLMSVMIYASMFPREGSEHVVQQRFEVRRLQEEEARVLARLAASRPEDLGASSMLEASELPPLPPPRSPTLSPVESLDSMSSLSSLDSIDRQLNGVSTPPGTHHRVPNVAAGTPSGNLYLTPRPKRTSRYATKFLTLMHRGAALLDFPKGDEVIEARSTMQMLKMDYERCLKQLSTLQAAIEVTLEITFNPETGLAYGNRDEATTLELINVLKWHGQNTLDCFYTHLMDSAALREIRQRAKTCLKVHARTQDVRPESYAEYLYRYDPELVLVRDGIPTPVVHGSYRSMPPIPRAPPARMSMAQAMRAAPAITWMPQGMRTPPARMSKYVPGSAIDPSVEMPVVRDDAIVSESRSTSHVFEDLPSVDDLVRRWTNIHTNDANVEPGVEASSDVQTPVEPTSDSDWDSHAQRE